MLHKRIRQHIRVLLAGMILTPGRKVNPALRTIGMEQKSFHYRVFA